jgi:hypothetical protein
MREIRTSSLMSGDGRRDGAERLSYRAHPRLYVRPEGAFDQWREDPPRELSIALVADERFGRVTGWIEAS